MFTKFYAGILVAVIVATSGCFAFFDYTYTKRQADYQQKVLTGGLQLIVDTLPQLSPDKQQAYFSIAMRLLGATVLGAKETASILNEKKMLFVSSGGVQLIHSEQGNLVWYLALKDGTSKLISFSGLSQQQFRAHALLLISHLKGNSVSGGLDVQLATLKPYSAFSVAITSVEHANLDPQQRQDILTNRVVVASTSEQDSMFNVYAPMGEGQILVVKNIPEFDALPIDTAITMLVLTITVLVLVAYWMIYVLSSRIKPIAEMVNDFGDGKLDARVSLKGRDHFFLLADRINQMAVRIKSLLDSQRSIMQAVSHELRTPLARMRFKLTFLDEFFDDNTGAQTNGIRSDILQVETLVDEILEYHKLTQQPELTLETLDLSNCTEGVWENLKELYPDINFELHTSEANDFQGDRRGVIRLLQNLCSNACKHAKSKLRLNSAYREGFIVINIDDDGVGISDEQKYKVFDAFFRADNRVNHEKKGYGLGLSIVQQIAELHGGHIAVGDSDLGGASFMVYLPVRQTHSLPIEAEC